MLRSHLHICNIEIKRFLNGVALVIIVVHVAGPTLSNCYTSTDIFVYAKVCMCICVVMPKIGPLHLKAVCRYSGKSIIHNHP